MLVYSEQANMIGISENAVLSFCTALSTDIAAIMVRVPKQPNTLGGRSAQVPCVPARFPGPYWGLEVTSLSRFVRNAMARTCQFLY